MVLPAIMSCIDRKSPRSVMMNVAKIARLSFVDIHFVRPIQTNLAHAEESRSI